MRTPGMWLPGGYMNVLHSGPTQPMPYPLDGSVGTTWHTPEQKAFKANRKKIGTLDDPDAGGYQLNQILWDKDNGDAEMTMLEATNDGWYTPAPMVRCDCPSNRRCSCQ